MKIKEVNMDIFKSNKVVLVHCISEDCAMGAGIALKFNQKIPRMKQMLKSIIEYNKISYPSAVEFRYIDTNLGLVTIINMITKKNYYNKPTYNDFKISLEKVKEICIKNNIKEITMPKIGCGLDRLNWYKVKNIIKCVFDDTDITINVCVWGDK